MIRIRTRIHDKFSVEFKLWLMETLTKENKPLKNNSFILESWSFIPGSLDINSVTYSREAFYADIKSYYRTITPVCTLYEMRKDENNQPFYYLSTIVETLIKETPNYNNSSIKEFEYQVKMFSAIFKSALRESYSKYKENKKHDVKLLTDQSLATFVGEMKSAIESYLSVNYKIKNNLPDKLYTSYIFGLEFCINLMQFYLYKILDTSQADGHCDIIVKEYLNWIADIKRENSLGQINTKDTENNSKLLYRWAILKKYVESDLFLSIDKKKSGMLTEQFYYSIAAGLSMVFATVISFTFQQRYGNFTLPFFIALVISYMFKDRIKELCRYAFANNRKINYFDHKIKLSVKDENIGVAREGVDFIPYDKVPQSIVNERLSNVIIDVDRKLRQDSVLFFRTKVDYNPQKLSGTQYKISGLNQILVFNLISFIKKMDDPKTVLRSVDLEKVDVDRVYYITLILRLTSKTDGETTIKHYRIAFNRTGIRQLEDLC